VSKEVIQQVTTSLISLIIIVGTFGIVAFQIVNGKPVQIPDIIVALVFGVSGAYFSHAASVNGARQAGAAAAQTAIAAGVTNGTHASGAP